MEKITRRLLLDLMNRDKVRHGTVQQAEDMNMSYHTLQWWKQRHVQTENYMNTDLKILNYLIENGYITITIHKTPLPY